ncbi:MAG: glycosyltransferase family 1 protein [Verrucomicrobiota bacterium]
MKIALITETFPPEVNGVAMTNQRLVRGLIERGHKLFLVKPRRSDSRASDHENLEICEVFGVPIPNYAGLKFGLPGPGTLRDYFQTVCPDVVHVATEGPLGFSALKAARRLQIPVTSTFHTNFQDYCADYGAAFLKKRVLDYLRWFHNQCELTTVPDPDLLKQLETAGINNLKVLGRGADTRLFSPTKRSAKLRATWGAPDYATPVAVYVGRAAAEKDIPLALEAWLGARKAIPNLKMVVVGDGPVRKKLEKEWPEVYFAGMRYDEDLAAHYASADIFIFGSTSETFGNVVIEAMSSGLAVLTYDYAAGRQFIRDGVNGFLAPYGDREAFCRVATHIAGNFPSLQKIRLAARATAETYPWSGTIDRFSSMLQSAVNKGAQIGEIGIVPAATNT